MLNISQNRILEIRKYTFTFSEKCQRVCNVQESGSKTRQRCKFPFKFKGKTFRSCTKFEVNVNLSYGFMKYYH